MKRLFFMIVLSVFVFSGCTSTKNMRAVQDENRNLRNDLEASGGRLKEMDSEVRDLKEKKAEAEEQNRAEIEKLKKGNEGLKSELDKEIKNRETIAGLRDENQDLRKELESSNNRLKKMEIEAGELRDKSRTAEDLTQAEIAKLKQVNDELKAGLSDEIKKGEIAIEQYKGKLVIRVAEALFFASGSAEIIEQGKDSLRTIGSALKKIPDKMIRVEGHTDDVPIGDRLKAKYPSNWELSSARAINVVKFLQKDAGVDAFRMSAAAFGPFNPIASNTTEEGKAKNRRIEIFVVDKDLDRLKQASDKKINAYGI